MKKVSNLFVKGGRFTAMLITFSLIFLILLLTFFVFETQETQAAPLQSSKSNGIEIRSVSTTWAFRYASSDEFVHADIISANFADKTIIFNLTKKELPTNTSLPASYKAKFSVQNTTPLDIKYYLTNDGGKTWDSSGFSFYNISSNGFVVRSDIELATSLPLLLKIDLGDTDNNVNVFGVRINFGQQTESIEIIQGTYAQIITDLVNYSFAMSQGSIDAMRIRGTTNELIGQDHGVGGEDIVEIMDANTYFGRALSSAAIGTVTCKFIENGTVRTTLRCKNSNNANDILEYYFYPHVKWVMVNSSIGSEEDWKFQLSGLNPGNATEPSLQLTYGDGTYDGAQVSEAADPVNIPEMWSTVYELATLKQFMYGIVEMEGKATAVSTSSVRAGGAPYSGLIRFASSAKQATHAQFGVLDDFDMPTSEAGRGREWVRSLYNRTFYSQNVSVVANQGTYQNVTAKELYFLQSNGNVNFTASMPNNFNNFKNNSWVFIQAGNWTTPTNLYIYNASGTGALTSSNIWWHATWDSSQVRWECGSSDPVCTAGTLLDNRTQICSSNGNCTNGGNTNSGSLYIVTAMDLSGTNRILFTNTSVVTETQYIDESSGRTAIETGIKNVLGNDIRIYTDQLVYVRNSTNYQKLGRFDKVTRYGNQIWTFNYLVDSQTYTNIPSLGTILNVLEMANRTSTSNITTSVQNFITSTKT